MPTRFRRYDSEQPLLPPPDLREWLHAGSIPASIAEIPFRIKSRAEIFKI